MQSQEFDGIFKGIDKLEEEIWPDNVAKPRSFYGAPLCPNPDELDAQVAFLGVPYDQGAGVPGARRGPDSIRDTGGFPPSIYSCSGPDGTMGAAGYYDLDADRQCLKGVTMADCGNVPIVPSNAERNFWRVTRTVERIVNKRPLLVTVGGDHAITTSVVRGFHAYETLDIVHFDAHLDFNEPTEGIPWTNGGPIRLCSEFPWVGNISQFGLRALKRRHLVDAARARGNRLVSADRFRELGPEAAMALVPESDAMYVTIDIDVLDPTVCPGTGAPEPGGLTYLQMRDALRALARRGRVVGIDVVEIAPNLDPTGMTAKTGSKLIVDFIDAIFDPSNPRSRSGAPA